MQVIEAIKSRKTIRGFKTTPVSKEILSAILEVATRAPSGANCQPWEFAVLGGKKLDDLKNELQRHFDLGVEPHPDFPTAHFTGVYRKRQVELGIELYQLLNIKREDTEKKRQWLIRMLWAFNAPNLIVISIDETAANNFTALLGLGAVMQTISLATMEYGLGTALLAALVQYPDIIKEVAGIPPSKKLVIAIAIGYPDWDAVPNRLETAREPIDNITTWIGM